MKHSVCGPLYNEQSQNVVKMADRNMAGFHVVTLLENYEPFNQGPKIRLQVQMKVSY